MAIGKNSERLTVIVSSKTKRKLKYLADKDGRSVSNYVSNLLKDHVNEFDIPEHVINITKVKD